jgi:hypothetical protein
MNTLRKRLDTVEDRVALQRHREESELLLSRNTETTQTQKGGAE